MGVCSIVLFVVGTIFAIIAGVVQYSVLPNIMEDQIIKNVVLLNNTEQFEMWETTPFPTQFKVYIFNVTNRDEVINGMKPKFEEIGPYVYDQYRYREDIDILHENGTLSYYQYQKFIFNPSLSSGTEEDVIFVLNMPLNSVMQQLDLNPLGGPLLQRLNRDLKKVFGIHNEIVSIVTVKELLFDGIKFCENYKLVDVMCQAILTEARQNKNIKDIDKTLYFSYFSYKNDSISDRKNDGLYEIKDGVEDVQDLGRIVNWEGESSLSIWKGDTCNMINGTDTTIYSPFRKKGESQYIFNTDICRSVRTDYKDVSEYEGVKTYRYEVYEDFLEAQTDTGCFCVRKTPGITQDNGCLKQGAMELHPCVDASLILTFPHFMWADEDYQNGVEGMKPDKDQHITFVELEPLTGVPILGSKRVQFNMFIRKIRNMDLTDKLSPVLFPILWIDESLTMPPEYLNKVKNILWYIDLVKIILWTVLGVSIFAAVVGIGLFCSARSRSKQTV